MSLQLQKQTTFIQAHYISTYFHVFIKITNVPELQWGMSFFYYKHVEISDSFWNEINEGK